MVRKEETRQLNAYAQAGKLRKGRSEPEGETEVGDKNGITVAIIMKEGLMAKHMRRISTDNNIMLGKPVITGTRITVEAICRKLSEGMSVEDLLLAYPNLAKGDILAVLSYAARAASWGDNLPSGEIKKMKKAVTSETKKALERPMLLKVSVRGNAVIPQAACKNLGLQPGDQFELIRKANELILVPANDRPRVYKKLNRQAVEVLKNEDNATLWLNRPQIGLGGEIPVKHMRTAKGAQDVEDLIGRIEHGVLT